MSDGAKSSAARHEHRDQRQSKQSDARETRSQPGYHGLTVPLASHGLTVN
jgi:hypothetical protein